MERGDDPLTVDAEELRCKTVQVMLENVLVLHEYDHYGVWGYGIYMIYIQNDKQGRHF